MLSRIRRIASRKPRRIINHYTIAERRANRNHLPAALEANDASARYATFMLRH